MLFWRNVLVTALIMSTAQATLSKYQTFQDASCTTAGHELFIKEVSCLRYGSGSVSVGSTAAADHIQYYTSTDCSGTSSSQISSLDNSCQNTFAGYVKLVQLGASVPTDGGKIRVNMGRSSTKCVEKDEEPDMIYQYTVNSCTPNTLPSAGSATTTTKFIVREISNDGLSNEEESLVTQAFYSTSDCSGTPSYASLPQLMNFCYLTDANEGPAANCATAPCAEASSTSHTMFKHLNIGNTPEDTVNLAKFRFYQDKNCKSPTTYTDPSTAAIAGRDTYNGANYGMTGSLNTAGTYFQGGEQTYDGNAPGQALYLPVDTNTGSQVCSVVQMGHQSSTLNSVGCTGSECRLYATTDCSGTYTSVSSTDSCIDKIYAKLESFATGIERHPAGSTSTFMSLQFAQTGPGVQGFSTNPTKAQECGGSPTVLVGGLDMCHVSANVANGHTWNAPTEKRICSYDWAAQMQAATEQTNVNDCKALCHSDVDCKAIAFGRDGEHNHKCVLCKDETLEGNDQWDVYTKEMTPPFVKVSGSTGSSLTFRTTYHTTSDCTGVGLTEFNTINRAGTCRSVAARAGGGRAASDDYLGVITLTDTLTATETVDTVLGQGLMQAGDNHASDAVGCPNVVNYVYDESVVDIGLSNGVNNNRVCSIVIQGPVGSLLALDFETFDLVGTCSGTPANCDCGTEHVTIRDGLRETSRQIGQAVCGSNPVSGVLFSGNTARLDVVLTESTSTFKVHPTFHYNKLHFEMPLNPTYQLGTDISIKWYTESSVSGWAACGSGNEQSTMQGMGSVNLQTSEWQRRLTCARGPAKDHGWVGIYRNGSCEDGPMAPHAVTEDPNSAVAGFRANSYVAGQQPHECYLGVQTIPMKETRGQLIFKYGRDYHTAGVYSLRYFAGDSSGTVCEVLAHASATDPADTKNAQCLYRPISRAEITITANPIASSGNTKRQQIIGYERTINY